jgi:hypothetical protein
MILIIHCKNYINEISLLVSLPLPSLSLSLSHSHSSISYCTVVILLFLLGCGYLNPQIGMLWLDGLLYVNLLSLLSPNRTPMEIF